MFIRFLHHHCNLCLEIHIQQKRSYSGLGYRLIVSALFNTKTTLFLKQPSWKKCKHFLVMYYFMAEIYKAKPNCASREHSIGKHKLST